MKAVIFVSGLAFLAFVAVSLFHGDDSHDSPGGPAQEISVRMTDMLRFEPADLRVEAGKPVALLIVNNGTALHDFSVSAMPVRNVTTGGGADHHGAPAGPASSIHLALDGGKSGTLRFTPTQPGEYRYLCTVSGHEAGGMAGKLIVT